AEHLRQSDPDVYALYQRYTAGSQPVFVQGNGVVIINNGQGRLVINRGNADNIDALSAKLRDAMDAAQLPNEQVQRVRAQVDAVREAHRALGIAARGVEHE